jgi:hypothetical protein
MDCTAAMGKAVDLHDGLGERHSRDHVANGFVECMQLVRLQVACDHTEVAEELLYQRNRLPSLNEVHSGGVSAIHVHQPSP